jgi:hypothetical protein
MKISIALATAAASATTAAAAAAASEATAVTRLRNTNVQNYKSLISSSATTTTTVRRDQSTIEEDDVGSLSMSLSFMNTDGLTSTTAAPVTATMSIPTSVAPTVTPTNLYICGGDYTDASTNFCTNPTCPTGDVSY